MQWDFFNGYMSEEKKRALDNRKDFFLTNFFNGYMSKEKKTALDNTKKNF
jgi:hypothetical protein